METSIRPAVACDTVNAATAALFGLRPGKGELSLSYSKCTVTINRSSQICNLVCLFCDQLGPDLNNNFASFSSCTSACLTVASFVKLKEHLNILLNTLLCFLAKISRSLHPLPGNSNAPGSHCGEPRNSWAHNPSVKTTTRFF